MANTLPRIPFDVVVDSIMQLPDAERKQIFLANRDLISSHGPRFDEREHDDSDSVEYDPTRKCNKCGFIPPMDWNTMVCPQFYRDEKCTGIVVLIDPTPTAQ